MLLELLSDKCGSSKEQAKAFAGEAQHCRVCDVQEAAVVVVKVIVHIRLVVLDSWHSSCAALPQIELGRKLGTERGSALQCSEMTMQREAAGGGSLTASMVRVMARLTLPLTSEQRPVASSDLSRMIGKVSGFWTSEGRWSKLPHLNCAIRRHLLRHRLQRVFGKRSWRPLMVRP